MNKNDLEKTEKSGHTIEITIPVNGVISGADVTSKKEQKNNESDASNSTEEDTSNKGQMSNISDSNNSSDEDNSKKTQLIINIK